MTNEIVKIVDEKGTYPDALDQAVEEQAAYYRRPTPEEKLTRLMLFDEYGNEDSVEIKGLTISLSNTVLPLPPCPKIRDGEHSVTGTVEVYYESPQLFQWFRAAAAAQQERMLRIVRPHMGKRQFQRFRGACRAQRRAAWRKARP